MVVNLFSGAPFDFSDRMNRNILVVGSSGSGKTVFSNDLLSLYPQDSVYRFEAMKDLKGFVPSDLVELSKSAPFLRDGKNEFIDSFVSTLPDPNGWFSSQVAPVLSALIEDFVRGKEEKEWTISSFRKFLKKKVEESSNKADLPILLSIKNRFLMLYPEQDGKSDFLSFHRFVFDGLNGLQKTFFYEFVLRILWKKTHELYVFLDEFHRVSNLQNSIIGEMLREIRTKGGILAVSQNLSDVLPAFVNQFGSLFIGSTISVDDLSFWRFAPDSVIKTILSLDRFEFFDVLSFLKVPGRSSLYGVSFVQKD